MSPMRGSLTTVLVGVVGRVAGLVALALTATATALVVVPQTAVATTALRGRAAACAPHVVGTWIDSPSDADSVGDEGLRPFVSGPEQTFREILTPHLGGTAVRVRLSNRFGSQPVTFGAVTVAHRLTGADLAAGTARPVLFAGQRSVTIPPGADVISDPVGFSFSPFQDLAVTLTRAATPARRPSTTAGASSPTPPLPARATTPPTATARRSHNRRPSGSSWTASTRARPERPARL